MHIESGHSLNRSFSKSFLFRFCWWWTVFNFDLLHYLKQPFFFFSFDNKTFNQIKLIISIVSVLKHKVYLFMKWNNVFRLNFVIIFLLFFSSTACLLLDALRFLFYFTCVIIVSVYTKTLKWIFFNQRQHSSKNY